MASASHELTIVSWNMWVLNRDFGDALEFIRALDFDILCLQEVPEAFLPQLRSLPFHSAIGQDSKWLKDSRHPEKGQDSDYLAIISKHPIAETHTYALPPARQHWRVILTRMLMGLLMPVRVSPIYDRELLSADIRVGDSVVRIFSVHFPLLTPAIRVAEFEITTEHALPGRTIICGDFNVLDHWTMKPLNWMQGGAFHQMLPWYNERAHLDARFADSGFVNPLAGLITQKISRSQLDHILVPKSAEVLERKVLSETHGSDHNPVVVRVRL